eukprot:6903369-Heterocapsa_arctica.AAC.1
MAVQPNPGQAGDTRRALDIEGFSQVFRKMIRTTQEQGEITSGNIRAATTPGFGEGRLEMEPEFDWKDSTEPQGNTKGTSSSSATGSHGHIITHN